MRMPISPKTHGVLDYMTWPVVALAPMALKLPKRARAVAYGLAGGMTGAALLTRYPAGAKKLIPLKAHGVADAAIGAALPFVPKLLHVKNKKARTRTRNFFWGVAAATGVVTLLTDWNRKTRTGTAKAAA